MKTFSPVHAWPLIGREDELARIASALGDATCQGVVVTAVAGLGKSRVAREAYALAEHEHRLAGWAQATRSAATVPLAAFAPLLPDGVRIDDTLELMRRSVDALRGDDRRRAVLAVDDAHLLDPVSAALLLHVAAHGVFVLLTVRSGEPCPDAVRSLWKDGSARRVELSPLADSSIAALVEAGLDGPVEAAALHWVVKSSQGNPLYAHELLIGATEAGTLVPQDGIWRLQGHPQVSRSLRELIVERTSVLPEGRRAPLELLGLGEPLRLKELVELTTHDALLEAEAHGLIVMDTSDELRLAHPLFGEVLSGALGALRARSLRLRLAGKLSERTPLAGDDALRIARLLMDAGEEIPPGMRLTAARAANLAGDPGLGAELAALAIDDAGLSAAILLARAHTMRNRLEEAEAVLAAVEPLAPGHPEAFDYLVARVWTLYWGLYRREAMLALLARAADWLPEDAWRSRVARLHRSYASLSDGVGGPVESDLALADPTLSDRTRRAGLALQALRLLSSGDGDGASAVAERFRPPVPLRDTSDLAQLGVLGLVTLETGHDWSNVERYMGTALPDAVRGNDHDAAGLAAFALAGLHFMRGEYRTAARWHAEAEIHLAQQDTIRAIVQVRAYRVGVALLSGEDPAAALERLHEALDGHDALPHQLPYILRAEGWAARARSDRAAVKVLLAGADTLAESPLFAVQLLYEALRAGGRVAERLADVAASCQAPLVSAYAAHAAATGGADLLAVAAAFESIGARRYAMEAATQAATAFVREGRSDSARRAAARARELFAPGQGAEPPAIDGLDTSAIELSPREAQVAGLAARGLSNVEIADRLVLSVRTVEAHLYRAMQKLGIRDRRDL
jgi:DNA-binding NarL/FixJ family response regulator